MLKMMTLPMGILMVVGVLYSLLLSIPFAEHYRLTNDSEINSLWLFGMFGIFIASSLVVMGHAAQERRNR